MDKWTYERGVELDFSRPGKPTDNAKIESFSGRLRQECLNMHWFLSLDDARIKIEAWQQYYNCETRTYSALQLEVGHSSRAKPWKMPHRRQSRRQKLLFNVGTNSGTGSLRMPAEVKEALEEGHDEVVAH